MKGKTRARLLAGRQIITNEALTAKSTRRPDFDSQLNDRLTKVWIDRRNAPPFGHPIILKGDDQ